MKRFVLSVLCVFIGAAALCDEPADLNVLPPNIGKDMLKQYLLGECKKHFDSRRKAIEAIKTPEDFYKRQKHIREEWVKALGGFPERTPLNPQITGALDRDECRIEKVIYESRPNHHVTANLYLPKTGQPPYPGVLLPCGHSGNGKAYKAYHTAGVLLAQHGFVVLCYDPIGQGERCQALAENGKPIVQGTTEHSLEDVGAMLVGWDCATYRIWDGIRSIDYLVSRPEVDAKRIGCTGNSGGGTMTSYLMATDDRIVAAAPSCYITSLERLFETIGPQDGEQNIPGQTALGIEHADFAHMRAPKPTLFLTATFDFFDIGGTWTTFREIKRMYAILGHTERADILEVPEKHSFDRPQREAALRWMRRWLQNTDDAAMEGDIKTNTDAELQVTKCGQVVREMKGKTVWDLNLEQAKKLAPAREAFWKENPKEKCLDEVRRLAGIRKDTPKPSARTVGTLQRDGCKIEKLVIEREGEVPVPALLFLPETQGKAPGVLYVDGRGKGRDAGPDGPVEKLVKAGHAVLSIDMRGFGETAEAPPKDYFGSGYQNPFLATHIGRCLLGQRVEDALAALDVLADRPDMDASKLSIISIERGGPVALHAAALDERIKSVTIDGAIESWMDVVATPLGKDQLTQVVPGVLTRYDLPDLVKAIAPRPVEIRNPVHPTGEPKQEGK
ncbi:MAG: acetylxylan esterase [Planctomycetota bacterium]